MKAFRIIFCMLGIFALSACSGMGDLNDWIHNKPSTMEKKVGPAPSGYARHEQPVALKAPSSMQSESGLIWNQIYSEEDIGSRPGNGRPVEIMKPEGIVAVDTAVWKDVGDIEERSAPVTLTTEAAAAPAFEPEPQPVSDGTVEYSRDVTIFPVDGDSSAYSSPFEPLAHMPSGAITSRLIQQIFFGYGSAKAGGPDLRKLHELSADLMKSSGDYHVSVVGHASKRVDNVKDTVQRKKINSVMAEKRAQAVTDELHNAGLAPSKVIALSRGEEVPNSHPGNKSQEVADRRVEIFVDGK